MRKIAAQAGRPMTSSRLISFQGAEREYGPPATSWRDQVARGNLRSIRLGRRVWLDRGDVERFLEAGGR